MFERLINIERMETAVSLFGSFDENIKLIEREFNVRVIVRGAELKIQGDVEDVMQAEKAVEGLLHLLGKGEALNEQNVRYVISMVKEGSEEGLRAMGGDCVCITAKGKPIKPNPVRAQGDISSLCGAARKERPRLLLLLLQGGDR